MQSDNCITFKVDPDIFIEEIMKMFKKEIKELKEELLGKINDSTPDSIKVRAAALLTGYEKSYMYQLVRNKAIPYMKLDSGALRFSRKELQLWIAKGKPHTNNKHIDQMSTDYIVNSKSNKLHVAK